MGSASAAIFVSKMIVSYRTSWAIALSFMSSGLRPDLRRIYSHSGDIFFVWNLPCLSIQTEFDFTTSKTTDYSSFCFYDFLKMFLILPKKEPPFSSFIFYSAYFFLIFLISTKVSYLGAYSSNFLASIWASTSFRNWMQIVPSRHRSNPHKFLALSFSR